MPRVHTLKGEIGTSGRIESIDVRQGVRGAIGEAVELEHSCHDQSSCDIAAALENGFPFSAAYLLIGATEVPLLETVVSFFGVSFSPQPEDWQEWYEWHSANSVKCESCKAYNYGDAETCGNCLAVLPTNDNDEED